MINSAGVTKTSIDVTKLAKGSYFVVFTGDNNVMTTRIRKLGASFNGDFEYLLLSGRINNFNCNLDDC